MRELVIEWMHIRQMSQLNTAQSVVYLKREYVDGCARTEAGRVVSRSVERTTPLEL